MPARWVRKSWVGLVLFLAIAPAVAARTGDPGSGRAAYPGVVIVKLREPLPQGMAKSTGLAAVDALLAAHGGGEWTPVLRGKRPVRKPGRTDLGRVYRVRYADGAPPEAVAALLAARSEVEYAEPQWIHTLDAVPNDPQYPNQASAGYNSMRMAQAWDVAKGEQGSVVVAIADGGIAWQHEDLTGSIWTNPGEIPGNSIDDDGNGFVDDIRGWNFANESNDPTGLPLTPNNAAHGTHVSGSACAVTNNAVGVAGTSWGAKLMPICVSSPTSDNAIAFGFDGVLYAADNGADVVNCSWGSLGAASQYELEVVEYAWGLGTAVVAAAGNQSSTQPHYPSAYPHVLSVANVNNSGVLVNSSNRGATIDLCAPGLNTVSTWPGNAYALLTGTSMSSPQVAGICALVKTRYPGYTADQVMERVRATCDDIDPVNFSRRGQLGKGRANAEAALLKNTPSVRITRSTLTETDGDGIVEPGETVTLVLEVTNYLAACTNLTFKLRETSSHASVADSIVTLGALDSLATALLPPLTLTVAPTAPIQHVVNLIVAMDAASPLYTDRDRLYFTVLPTFVNHDIGRVQTSVTSVGKLGFSGSAGGTGSDGVGFKYGTTANLLFEGALMIGISDTRVSSAARGNDPNVQDDDFLTLAGGTPHLSEPGLWAPEQSIARFSDQLASQPLPVSVTQESYAYGDPTHDDAVILRYWIRNAGAAQLSGLRVGWFCDWDVDGGSYETNRTGFDGARQLGYVYDTGGGPTEYIGIQVLNAAGATSYRGIWNNQALAPDWGVYDNYTTAEKWQSLAGGIVHPEAGPADVSNAIATGPFTLAVGDSVEVGFAFLGGENLAALQANADAAAVKWQHLHSGVAVVLHDLTAEQEGDDVVVRWRTSAERDVAAFRVYRGRPGAALEPLAPDVPPAGDHRYSFRDPAPGQGTFVYRIGEVDARGSVTLHGSTGIHVSSPLPTRTFLDPAIPNPFNPSTTLRFGLQHAGPVTVQVFDSRGRLVRTLAREAWAPAGFYRSSWNGIDARGSRVASGVYLVRLVTGGTSITRRVTLLK